MRLLGLFKEEEAMEVLLTPETKSQDVARITRDILEKIRIAAKGPKSQKSILLVYYSGPSSFQNGSLKIELPSGGTFPIQESLSITGAEGESLVWFIFDTDRKSEKGAVSLTEQKHKNVLVQYTSEINRRRRRDFAE